MKQVYVHNVNRPGVRPLIAGYADSYLARLRGLTFSGALPLERGLLLVQKTDTRLDAAIHMLGVFTNLAVAWINKDGEVVDTCLARAWRPMYIPRRPCRYVLEFSPSRLEDFQTGDRVRLEEVFLD